MWQREAIGDRGFGGLEGENLTGIKGKDVKTENTEYRGLLSGLRWDMAVCLLTKGNDSSERNNGAWG